MFAKLYWFTWLLIGAIAAVTFVAGSMTNFALVVFGFVAFGMTFAGMMCVLPWLLTHASPAPVKAERVSRSPETVPVAAGVHSVAHI